MSTPVRQARHVALLRGVNLGPVRRVPMAALRELAAGLGYTGVSTYLNSGNLLFTAPEDEAGHVSRLRTALAGYFGFDVPVAVRTSAQLAAAVAASPFREGDPARVCIAFLGEAPSADVVAALQAAAAPDERLAVLGRDVHLDFAAGLASSRLAANLPALVGQPVATVRNVRTCSTLVALLDQRGSSEVGPAEG